MQVFNLCIKILKKNLPLMFMYIVMFLAISLIITLSTINDQKSITSFSQVKSNVAFVSEDNSMLVDGFKTELGKIANFVELPNGTEALQDALFFRSVTYIIRIPKNFTSDFMSGKDVSLEKTIIPNSVSNIYIDLCIEKYFNNARLYVQNMDGISQRELVKYLEADFTTVTDIEIKTNGDKTADTTFANYYFNYMAFSLLAVLILGMSTLIIVFNSKDIKMRNRCSPLSNGNFNRQFILAMLVFTIATWLIMVLFCIFFNFSSSFNITTLYFMLNSFVFAICCAGISFLIGNTINSREAISAVSNVVTLGSCFLGGVFVPQQFLGSTVLSFAQFLPTYWFVKANNQIAIINDFSMTNLEPVFKSILIELAFAAVFFTITLLVIRRNATD
jgi:ABC-2 type transport system permease protein